MRRLALRAPLAPSLVVMILALAGPAGAITVPELRCQEALARSARGYVRRLHKAELACANVGAAGGTCNQSAVDAREQRAAAMLESGIAGRCTSQQLESIGFPAQCIDQNGAPFTPADAAQCIRQTHSARVDTMIAYEYPGAPGPLAGQDLSCQRTIGNAGRRFTHDLLRTRQTCLNRRFRGRVPMNIDCYDDGEPRTTGDARTDRRLARASVNLGQEIAAACSGANPESLGYPGSCSDPDGAPFTLANAIGCLDDTHGTLATAMVAIEYAVGSAPGTTTSSTAPGATTTSTSTTAPGATSTTTSTTLPDFESLGESVLPTGDADGDGFSNMEELAACSDPTSAASTPLNDHSLCLNQTPYSDALGPAWGNTDRQTEPSYNAAVTLLGVQNGADCGVYCATTPNIGSPAACSGANWPYTGVPEHGVYGDGETVEVTFPDEDGNNLHGTIFLPPGVTCAPDTEPVCDGATDAVTCTAPGGATYPAVVICDGFLASQRMYNWAAHRLARQGYIAMTFDVSGQGRSQGTFPNGDADLSSDVADQSPFSRDVGTATNFIVSAANPVRDLIEVDPLLIVNQGTGAASHTEQYVLGNAGHSYGARGTITYQQSTETTEYPVRTRAVVAWSHFDNAGTIGNVPVQLQSGDEDAGFIQPPGSGNIVPEMQRRFDRLGGDRDLDTVTDFTKHDRQIVMIADATHLSWSEGPYFYYPTWAEEVAYHYTLAWFDKYLKGDVARTMSDVTGNVINSVDVPTDYAECVAGPGCFSATERLKMVHPHLSDTWCSRYDVAGDLEGDVKGAGCQTQ